jgi:hypothetical protein
VGLFITKMHPQAGKTPCQASLSRSKTSQAHYMRSYKRAVVRGTAGSTQGACLLTQAGAATQRKQHTDNTFRKQPPTARCKLTHSKCQKHESE